jgi:hypothetical protein
LATAKAQADQAAGLYEGGYSDEYQEGFTRKGDPRKQAGVIPVHQGEFVANHRAVANPDIRPILNVIDRHQKMGDIAMLNTPRMLSEAYGIGLQRGGFNGSTGGGSHDSAPGGYPPGQGTADSSALLPILERIERNTAQSLTVRTLRDEIRHEESLESRAHR